MKERKKGKKKKAPPPPIFDLVGIKIKTQLLVIVHCLRVPKKIRQFCIFAYFSEHLIPINWENSF